MTPSEKLEQALENLKKAYPKSSHGIKIRISMVTELIESALSDLSNTSSNNIEENSKSLDKDLDIYFQQSAEDILREHCVLVNKSQCEELLKAVEACTDWRWPDGDLPTQWSPFVEFSDEYYYIWLGPKYDHLGLGWDWDNEYIETDINEISFKDAMQILSR